MVNKPEELRRGQLANVKLAIDRVFRMFGIEESREQITDIAEFEGRMEEIVARYYSELTDMAYQVLQMSKSLIRYPDHEELFLVMDVFANNVMQIEDSYAVMMQSKNETLTEHISRMGNVFEEVSKAEGEMARGATVMSMDRMGIAVRRNADSHEESTQTDQPSGE